MKIDNYNKVDTSPVGFAIDTSGTPGVGCAFSVACSCFREKDLPIIADKLQTIRDVHGCDRPIHFVELGRSGACESVARDWVRLILKSPDFPAHVKILVVPYAGFELRYYDGCPQTALNRIARMAITSNLRWLPGRIHPNSITTYVDSSDDSHGGIRNQMDYFSDVIYYESRKRPGLHPIFHTDAKAIKKRPLANRGTELRALQDILALTDVLAGASRQILDPASESSMKTTISGILQSHMSNRAAPCRRTTGRFGSANIRRVDTVDIKILKFPAKQFCEIDDYHKRN